MGTEVLTPQDFFYDRFRLTPPAFNRRKTYLSNPKPNNSGHKRQVQPRPDRSEQKKKPQQAQPQPPPRPQQKHEQQQLVLSRRASSANELQAQTGRITILRRGQSLDTTDATSMKRDLNNATNGTLMRKNCMEEDDVYAGSAFFVSPSPSSLPLPSFFNNTNGSSNMNNDSATRDLRRLLRLD